MPHLHKQFLKELVPPSLGVSLCWDYEEWKLAADEIDSKWDWYDPARIFEL